MIFRSRLPSGNFRRDREREEREKEREKERARERERETERQRERDRERQRERQRETERETERDRERQRETERENGPDPMPFNEFQKLFLFSLIFTSHRQDDITQSAFTCSNLAIVYKV